MREATREIGGVYLGDRNVASPKALWGSMPGTCQQYAMVYSDFWSAYGVMLPSKRHRKVGKETGKTSYIEWFN